MAYRTTENPSYKHPLWGTWKGIRTRCNNPNNPKYPKYGGRGIKMCNRWDSFQLFVEDMGDKPSYDFHEGTRMPLYTVGRIDNTKGYSPDNCRWESSSQQSRNREDNVYLIENGVKYYLTDLRDKYGVSSGAYYSRIKSGWSKLRAATTPPIKR